MKTSTEDVTDTEMVKELGSLLCICFGFGFLL